MSLSSEVVRTQKIILVLVSDLDVSFWILLWLGNTICTFLLTYFAFIFCDFSSSFVLRFFFPFSFLMSTLDGLCSHRKETSSIVCLGNLRRLTSKLSVDIGLMWKFRFGWFLCSYKQATWLTGVLSYVFMSRCKVQSFIFWIDLVRFFILSVVSFSLACGWGIIWDEGFVHFGVFSCM